MNINNKDCNFRSFRTLNSMLNHSVLRFNENRTDMTSVKKWQTAKSRGSVKISNVSKEALIILADEYLAVLALTCKYSIHRKVPLR